jgi:polyisoprenoid-binding protein YceI
MEIDMRAILPTAALLAGLALCAPAWASMSLVGKPKVGFLMTGNMLNVEGETSTVTLKDDGQKLTFTVPMSTVTTGIGLRDDHMRKNFVHVDQYPDVALAIPKSAVTWPAAVGESTKGTTTAAFTAHGVTLDVPVTYTIKKSKDSLKVTASFPFDVKAHGIDEALSYMGVSFEPVVKGTVALELADAP